MTGKKIRQQLDVKQQAFPSEPKLKKRRLYVRDVYNKCTTRKKNIGKANICALKNKQFSHKKEVLFLTEENKQHNYFINNTHKDNNNNNNDDDDFITGY